MGRIEYEYPLFKVYYSNNSNNSNIRGNPECFTICLFLPLVRVAVHVGERVEGEADAVQSCAVGINREDLVIFEMRSKTY